METSLIEEVWQRACERCEYCPVPQSAAVAPFEIDHIIALKHGGKTLSRNLALACFHCNNYKGPNIAGLDPRTGKLTPLFHPRRQLTRFRFGERVNESLVHS